VHGGIFFDMWLLIMCAATLTDEEGRSEGRSSLTPSRSSRSQSPSLRGRHASPSRDRRTPRQSTGTGSRSRSAVFTPSGDTEGSGASWERRRSAGRNRSATPTRTRIGQTPANTPAGTSVEMDGNDLATPISPLQHLHFSSPHHASHHDNTKEILEFELNEEMPLLEELKRLCVLEKPSKREERLNRDGKWCAVTCQKLDVSLILLVVYV
jgi:hypothetical protein